MNLQTQPSELRLVGIGASAGGLEPLQAFFGAAPVDAGFAYVVVQHLSPDFKSLMPELLQRHTAMPVVSVTEDVVLKPDTVHVLAAGLLLTLEGEVLRTHPRQAGAALDFPISTLFVSMASLGVRAIAIVLSGTGSDGTVGAQSVHAAGGLVIAQSPNTARFEAMPRGVIDSGCADIVTNPEDMPRAIAGWVADPVQGRHFGPRSTPSGESTGGEYGPILAILNATYNIDFEHYKPGTIIRRIERRLIAGPTPVSAAAYAQRVATDRSELDRLFSDLLVGVTRFFRDEEAYLQLQSQVLEPAVLSLPQHDELRIWSCGCSTGEEAYSLAMLAVETFDRMSKRARLRVLATDLHGAALQVASQGVYSPESVASVPDDLRQRYFVLQPSGLYKVSDDLRRMVIFSAHNVLRDAAFTRIDVVTCRNLLIYLQPQAQKRALAAFHFALRPGGALLLGESEGVNELPDGFEAVERDAHLFRKLPGTRMPAELLGPLLVRSPSKPASAALDTRAGKRLDELVMQRCMPDCLLVNARFELMHVYGGAARFLHPTSGRFASDLTSLLHAPLRSAITVALRKAAQTGTDVVLDDLPDDADPDARLAVSVEPLIDRSLPQQYFLVRLTQQSQYAPAAARAADPSPDQQATLHSQQIDELEAELGRVHEALQHTIEELESANQELQAGNEELMAANEELQSTNEELHAVNEELYSVNAEHESKINELRETTSDLNNLIRATELAILFLDGNVRLRMFTPPAAALFPLQPQDIGRDLRDFMPKEGDADLFGDIETALAQPQLIDREFTLADGRALRRRIVPYRDASGRASGLVLTYLDITDDVRHRDEAASLAGRRMYQAVAESSPILMWSLDVDRQLVWAGPQVEQFDGLPFAERSDPPWPQPTGDDDRSALEAHRAALADGRSFVGRHRLRRRDGKLRWFQVQSVPQRDAAGKLLRWFGWAVDVHDLVEAQHQLAEHDAFLRLVTDNVSGLIAYADHDGVIRFANRQYLAWFGKQPEEVVGRDVAAAFGPDWWSLLERPFAASLRGEPQSVDGDVRHTDGQMRRVFAHCLSDSVDTRVRGVFIHVVDVTALYEARSTVEKLLDLLPLGTLVVDRSGRIVRVNAEMAALAGYDTAKLTGSSVEDLIPEVHRQRHEVLRAGYMTKPQARPMGQRPWTPFPLLRGDGTTIDVDIALTPCTYMGQSATMAVVRDLRTLALMSTDEAQRADTARSTFLATMSHEIRTPLHAIRGMAELLELESPTPRQRERLKGIGDASMHLLEIVNDVLDLAQIESGHLRVTRSVFTVADLVDRSVAMVADRARLKHLELTHAIEADVPATLLGDSRRIEQILVNLLSNAVKFTPGGRVHVAVSCREVSGNGRMLRVEVLDTGVGIAAEQMPRLFKPFEQLERSSARRYGGTGLGLAISRHLARAMGGDCGASSQPGIGSQFWFTVMVGSVFHDGTGNRLESSKPATDPVGLKALMAGRRLLVVEDDRVNQLILVDTLRIMGADRVDVAATGQEAIDAACAADYDLVFMDMQLPGIDGLEATRRIVEQRGTARPPIVALSANVLPEDVARCLEVGMDAHLPKPISRDELASAIVRWLRRESAPGAA